MEPHEIAKRYRVESGEDFRLKDFDPGDTHEWKSKEHAHDALEQGIARLTDLQQKLYAQDRWALLVVLQAMDAAGKDSTIKHVMSGVNPQGCHVTSFKSPSAEELDHAFLWRTLRVFPARGTIGIFNRSYYEEVLIVRVHPELLDDEHLPAGLITKKIWEERFYDINAIERYAHRNGIVVLKFFLHVSRKEQKKRFLQRLDEPEKNWKFSASDVHERQYWDKYMAAYEEMIQSTSTKHAPWYVVPADHKWFTRLVVADAIVSALSELNLSFPKVDAKRLKDLKAARKELAREK
jgi:PPK2 family polyphosphate:nucleotide phosphotransferase